MKKSLLICLLAVVLCVTMLFAACAPSLEADTLNSMKELLRQMYKDSNPTTTYEVVGMVAANGEKANVSWAIEVTAGDANAVKLGKFENNKQTIEVDSFPADDVAYTLTATLTNEKGKAYEIDGQPVSISFERSLKKFVVNTYEEYVAAAESNSTESVTIRAYVIGVVCMESSSKGSLYLQDADGHGYYAYAPAGAADGCETTEDLRAKWPVGTEVFVTGTVTVYNGQYEFNKNCEIILSGETATADQLPYVDATADFAAASSNTDNAKLLKYQNRRVTLKDATITKVEIQLNDDGSYNRVYYYFTLPNSDVEFNVYYTIYFIDETTMLALHDQLQVGKMVDLTGVVSVYSKAFQIYPDSATSVSNVREITYTDAEKVAIAKQNLTFVDVATEGTSVELPATGELGTTITWALDGEYTNATIADGKLTVSEQLADTVVLKVVATLTNGTATDTVTFEVTVPAARTSFIKAALNAGAALADKAQTEDSYIIIGTVSEITSAYSEQYKNVSFNVVDAEGNTLIIFRYNLEDAATIKVGDFFACAAPIKKWGSDIEAVATYTKLDVTTLKAAAEAGLAGTGVEGTQVYGYVTEINSAYSEQYGNITVTISDGTNEFYIYRMKGGQDVQVGDYLLITGTPSAYKGAAQMAAGSTYVKSPIYVASAPAHTCESKCETCGKCTDAACTETACAEKCEGHEVDTPDASEVKLTVTSLGLKSESYATGTVTVNGSTFQFIQLGNYGNGIQMRDKDGKTSFLWNTVAFSKPIARIELVYSSTQEVKYSNSNAVIFSFGNAADSLTYTTKLSTVAGQKTYTITPDAETYTFFKLEHDLQYTFYWDSITIVFAEGGSTPPAHTCESKCETCGKCLDAACTETACAEKCQGHEPAAVVINGTEYTQAQAEEALKALKAGDVVTILANATIAQEHTFVAANYVLGENVTLVFQANVVAPVGTKLTVGAGSKIVVESGKHIDISALTQDDFATSQSARLEIAADAKVTMPAYTEQLWNDTYLRGVIEAMVADSDVGAQLVLGSTTLTKTANGWEAPAPVAEIYTLVIPSESFTWAADTLINDIFYASNKAKTESIKIDGASYEADGLTFSGKQISLTGGKVQFTDGAWLNSISFTVPAGKQATVVVYAAQKEGKTTNLKVMNADAEEVTVTGLLINGAAAEAFDTLPTTSVSKYEFALAEGTYHIGGAAGGAYVYGMTVTFTVPAPAHVCESVCPECNKCLDAACTETACAEKCEGHKVAVTVVTYNFATSSTKKGSELSASSALALFKASSTSTDLVSVAATKAYDGNGDGGAYAQKSGFIKMGTGKANGKLVLTFAEGKKVAKVEIKCHDWYTKSASYPTNSNKVSVNGSAAVLAPYNETGAPEVLTFELDGTSNVVTIETSKRAFIFEIVITFAE